MVPTQRIPVIGMVQAGAWFESTEWPDEDRYDIAAPTGVGPLALACYGLVVKGDSMNLRYTEGTVLTVMPLTKYPQELKNGDNVVVHRNRAGIVEATVKELVMSGGGDMELWPRSSNPKFQEPVSFHGPAPKKGRKSDVETVEIIAVVIGSYQMEKKF
jgi:SOS-response transcriptional repressor LexA